MKLIQGENLDSSDEMLEGGNNDGTS